MDIDYKLKKNYPNPMNSNSHFVLKKLQKISAILYLNPALFQNYLTCIIRRRYTS